MSDDLKVFLESLLRLKFHPDEFGGQYMCFGCYDENCWRRSSGEPESRLCTICRHMASDSGTDWIDEEIKRG